MIENNRNPIEIHRKKLPQFTTMNVIDGQAGLINYSSLIFYSLTIDNILNIVVLLILAGVTIATLTGDNGILTRANDAKTKTEEAEDIEKIKLAISEAQMGEDGFQELTTDNLGYELIKDGTKAIVSDNEDGTKHILFLDEKKEYKLDNNGNIEDLNIDFDTKYVAPSSQDEERNEGVIGIGTDGKPVDMDLWEYTLLDDGTYALNDEISLAGSDTRTAGYTGNIIDGGIEGTIPQYIKNNIDSNFIEVTNLESLFRGCDLTDTPKIPCTVTNLSRTFQYCSQLIKVLEIPKGVTNMYGTFAQCSLLEEPPEIPINVTSMAKTFLDCTNLKEAPKIPSKVIDMEGTFQNCSQLKNPPEIPIGVVNMDASFRLCSSLDTVPKIPDTVKNLKNTFYGCTSLENITIVIPNTVETMTSMLHGCPKLCGNITILANISDIEDERYIFANSNLSEYTTEKLEVLCTEEIYNKYYDESQPYKLNTDIFGYSPSNIYLTKIETVK